MPPSLVAPASHSPPAWPAWRQGPRLRARSSSMQRQCKRSFVFSQQMSQPRRLSFAGELSALLPTPKAHAAAACGGALCSVAHPSWSLRRTDTCFSSHPHTRPSLLIPAPLPFHCRSLTALLALKKGGTEYCQTLTSCGGVECILQCLDAHPTSAALHAPAINMLRAVAHNRTDALRFPTSGSWTDQMRRTLKKLCAKPSELPKLQEGWHLRV